MKGDIYAINCAGCLTPQFVYGGDLKHYQITETDHLYKTHCPCCKQIMLVPALESFMNLVYRAPRPPFVPYVPKSPAAAIPPVGPASRMGLSELRESRPLATSAWGLSESPEEASESLLESALAQGKEHANIFKTALNMAYNPVDEDEESESDDELGWGS